jgi:hypothetical protein
MPMPLLWRQIQTLVWKDLVLIFSRKSRLYTIYRAWVAPIVVAIYLAFIFRVYFPKATYGIGTPEDIRSLTDAMQYAAGTRDDLILVNLGPQGGDIDRVLNAVAGPPKAAGRNVTISTDPNVILTSCHSQLTGVTNCFAAVECKAK